MLNFLMSEKFYKIESKSNKKIIFSFLYLIFLSNTYIIERKIGEIF